MVNKIITPPTTSELISTVNEIIDDKQDKLTVGTGISISSGNVISVTAPTLINIAYNTSNNLSVFGGAIKGTYNTVIGNNAYLVVSNNCELNTVIGGYAGVTGDSYPVGATVIGGEARSYNSGCIAIGSNATAYGASSIQLGTGINNSAYTFQVGFRDLLDPYNSLNYQLLDGTTGLIPDARISSNIARSADIPAAQVNSDWNAVSGVAQILNKPTIPTVNNATLTITQGGVSKGTFTANASSDVTIALDAGGGSSYTAGTAIDITSDVISVKYDNSTITVNASGQLQAAMEAFTAAEVQTLWSSL